MNAQEIIAALAAELERIGKMPEWVKKSCGEHYLFEENSSGQDMQIFSEAIALAALSGVAAPILIEHDIKITILHECKNSDLIGWFIEDEDQEEPFLTYHEALIAALKQVETEKKS